MIFLLDTNVCISYLNGTSVSVQKRLRQTSPQDVVLCSVVKAELYFGALKSADRAGNLTRLENFFLPFASLMFDDDAAQAYGHIRLHLEQLGTPIGANDLMIAAITVAKGLTLVTHNASEFGRVKNLKMEDWQ